MSDNRQSRRLQQKNEERAAKLNEHVANAVSAMQAKDNVKASASLKLALAIDAENAQLLYLLASILNKDGKFSEAVNYARKAVSCVPGKPEYQKELGLALKGIGEFEGALTHLKEALRLKPDYADTHFAIVGIVENNPGLGIDMDKINSTIDNTKPLQKAYVQAIRTLYEKREFREAVACMKELCRLEKGNPDLRFDLAILYAAADDKISAIKTLAEYINNNPPNRDIKETFSSLCIGAEWINHFDQDIFDALLECLKNKYEANLHSCFNPWINMLLLRPEYQDFVQGMLFSRDDAFRWLDGIKPGQQSWLEDDYVLKGIKLILAGNLKLEKTLTYIRYYICNNAESLLSSGRYKLFFNFLCALAEQCFFNEYVFNQSQEETDNISRINDSLLNNFQSKSPEHAMFLLALSGSYSILGKTLAPLTETILNLQSENENWASMIKTQILDIQEERKIAATIRAFGNFANEISKNVQQQYEENPYPRWVSMAAGKTVNKTLPAEIENICDKPLNILVAGCGTGRHPISTAYKFTNAKVTAIDLSRASLAYGIRKAREIGLGDRIQFLHADILSMKDWPEQFDYIESIGVLHHMEDPLLGWKTLTDKLKPGGFFRNGLYSETARQFVVNARKVIHDKGFPSTTEGIRAIRTYIASLPEDAPLHIHTTASLDFFSTSTVRDLLLHVQEHRMTLPQIAGMIEKLGYRHIGLQFDGITLKNKYLQMFPDDTAITNLDNLHRFEQENPHAFATMYQFCCQKL